MFLVVMLEGDGQVAQGRRSIRLGHVADVVTLHGLHEALRHAVALWATHRSGQGQQADLPGKGPGLFGGIGRAVIVQPLHRRRRQLATEALLDSFQHHVADIVATVAMRAGHPADGLAVTAVQGEGHAQLVAILAAELEAIRTPTGVARVHGERLPSW